jgi:hypothetical protein
MLFRSMVRRKAEWGGTCRVISDICFFRTRSFNHDFMGIVTPEGLKNILVTAYCRYGFFVIWLSVGAPVSGSSWLPFYGILRKRS